MKFGVWTPIYYISKDDPSVRGPGDDMKRVRTEERDPGLQVAIDTVNAAAESGFVTTLIAQRLNGPDPEAWMMAAALATATSQIEIMSAVQPGLSNPAMAAKMAATVDRLSGGRFAANVIAGWIAEEHVVYGGVGLLTEDPTARYRRTQEFVDLMRAFWTEDEVTYQGEFYRYEKASVRLKPWSGHLPPIYAAARAEAGLEFVARTADCWFIDIDTPADTFEAALERTRVSIERMNERAARYGRKMRYAMQTIILHNEDERIARQEADVICQRASVGADPRQIEMGLVGSAARIAERIARYEEVGIELMLLKVKPWMAGVEDFASQIMPLLR